MVNGSGKTAAAVLIPNSMSAAAVPAPTGRSFAEKGVPKDKPKAKGRENGAAGQTDINKVVLYKDYQRAAGTFCDASKSHGFPSSSRTIRRYCTVKTQYAIDRLSKPLVRRVATAGSDEVSKKIEEGYKRSLKEQRACDNHATGRESAGSTQALCPTGSSDLTQKAQGSHKQLLVRGCLSGNALSVLEVKSAEAFRKRTHTAMEVEAKDQDTQGLQQKAAPPKPRKAKFTYKRPKVETEANDVENGGQGTFFIEENGVINIC